MPYCQDGRLRHRVVVVGGGISGLACARKILESHDNAIEVIMLEASDRLGGRIRGREWIEGVITDVGAEFVHGTGTMLTEWIEEFMETGVWGDRFQDGLEEYFTLSHADGGGRPDAALLGGRVAGAGISAGDLSRRGRAGDGGDRPAILSEPCLDRHECRDGQPDVRLRWVERGDWYVRDAGSGQGIRGFREVMGSAPFRQGFPPTLPHPRRNGACGWRKHAVSEICT